MGSKHSHGHDSNASNEMPVFPSATDFSQKIAAGENAGASLVVWTKFIVDLDTPLAIAMKLLAGNEKYGFFLESAETDTRNRYSIVGLNPDIVWKCYGAQSEAFYNPIFLDKIPDEPLHFDKCSLPALDSLRKFISDSQINPWPDDDLQPMAAGVFGYMGYEFSHLSETTIPQTNTDTLELPDAIMVRPSIIAIIDTFRSTVTLSVSVWNETVKKHLPDAMYNEIVRNLEVYKRKILDTQTCPVLQYPDTSSTSCADKQEKCHEPVSNMTYDQFCHMIGRAQEYIKAGDIFQVTLSQRWKVPLPCSAFTFYRHLRTENLTPYMFFCDFLDFSVVGASPEIMVRIKDGVVNLRPIAGTCPRVENKIENQKLADALLKDEKERAEHSMLVDLGRNDVGKVCKMGSVRVTEQFVIEKYTYVMHISSNITGELDPRYDALSVVLSALPAGTVSGAPKIRAMQIIDELENEKRGVYSGSIGYFSAKENTVDTCIALRTAVIKDGYLYAQAGGGIVHDSQAKMEYMESTNKAKSLLETVRLINR
jgi:anthranilate synthase component 1